jgi:hypothetical protein
MYPEDFDNLILESIDELNRLPREIQVAYCIHILEAEVNNGGFHQYFANSSGMFALETIIALSEIGAPKTRALLEGAIKIAYPRGYPDNREKYEQELADYDDIADLLEPLDDSFYEYEEPLTDLVNGYLSLTSKVRL